MQELRVSTSSEPPLQTSKWLKVPVLLDAEEMEGLLNSLGTHYLFLCGAVRPKGKGFLSQSEFLQHYAGYIDNLKEGILPPIDSYKNWFSPAMTVTTEALYSIPIGEGQEIVRVAKPVVQMQAHMMDYSPIDKKFRSMIYGSESIPWGIQFSYPQLFQDPVTKQVESTKNTPDFPNYHLFHALQKWVRQNTIPAPFFVEGVLHNVPMRLGKKCLSWINRHPQLVKKGISVKDTL